MLLPVFKIHVMKTVNDVLLIVAKLIVVYLCLLGCWILTQFVTRGSDYIETFEKKYYDYRLYLHENDIRIEDKTGVSNTIHPDSLEEFIIQDNL